MMYLINKNVTIFILETEVLNYPKSCLKKLNVIKTYSKWMSQGLIFHEISVIGPWVSKINWYECGLTYMVVRLSNVRSKTGKTGKTGKKCIFCVFVGFRSCVGQPDNLKGWATLMPFASIYRTRAIISRGLHIFLPHFQRPFMYCDLWPYVWLVFKSGF